jgi:hypothetical protein
MVGVKTDTATPMAAIMMNITSCVGITGLLSADYIKCKII